MSAVLQQDLLEFRRMGVDDVDAVHQIEIEAYQFPWSQMVFLKCLEADYDCWLLHKDGEIIGYGMIAVGADECHLLNICIASAHQNQGHGRTFLRFLIDQASILGAQAMFLEVRASNPKALRLYLAEGFRQVGLRKRYYPVHNGREDAMVMTRAI